MFKKSEESEWTRFSRALAGAKEQARETEDVAEAEDELLDDDATTVNPSSAAHIPPPPPPPPPAPPVSRQPATEDPVARSRTPRPPVPTLTPEPAPEPPRPPVSPPSLPDAMSAPRTIGDEAESVIGEGTTVEGTFRSEHSVHILGSIQGEVQSRQRVVVEQNARVNAKISAEAVTILGEVNGEVTCPGRVEITATGQVTGEINAGSLVMQEGAYFEGHLKMLNKSAPAFDDVEDET